MRWMLAGLVLVGVACGGAQVGGNPSTTTGGGTNGGSTAGSSSSTSALSGSVQQLACARTATLTAVNNFGTSITTTYYAEYDDSTIDPASPPHITALACDLQYFGPPPATCPAGATCTQNGTYPQSRCSSVGVDVDAGRIVVLCGSKTTDGTGVGASGQAFQTVYLRLN